jgi:fructose-bisphosphate aldolase class II
MRDKIIKIFKEAQRKKIALGQFNFSDISQFKAIVATAKKLKKPFILGTSEGESEFLSFKLAAALRNIAQEELGFPVILNFDHGKSFLKIKAAIDAGYDMVHFDGSSLTLNQNIKETKKVVNYAKKRGVIVEGELGYLGGSSEVHKHVVKIKKEDMTLPEEAEKFVKEAKIDALAVVIGNIHGIYAKMPHLDLERLSMIKNKVGNRAFLVLHGGSGISEKEIKKAIKIGIVKININTEIRAAWKKGLELGLKKNKNEIAPYKIFPEALKTVSKIVEKKIKLFSS